MDIRKITKIAQNAGEAILDIYNSDDFGIQAKLDKSPLTKADLSAHQIICRELASLDASIPVLSEESKTINYEKRRHWHKYWLVDPLDGTREFIAQNGNFTVNIALIENNQPVLGVVYAPVSAKLFFAELNKGAFYCAQDSTPIQLQVKKPGEELVVIASKRHGLDKLQSFFAKIGKHKLVNIGSSLKFCLLAQGLADLYPRFSPTSEWDTAAAHCVLNEAGGGVFQLSGEPLVYNKESLLNPSFLAVGDRTFAWKKFL